MKIESVEKMEPLGFGTWAVTQHDAERNVSSFTYWRTGESIEDQPMTAAETMVSALCERAIKADELIGYLLEAVLVESHDSDVEDIEAVKMAREWLGRPKEDSE